MQATCSDLKWRAWCHASGCSPHVGTQCCDWTARQDSPFFHPIGQKEVLSRQLSPRVSRLSVCGTGLRCWTKWKCSSDEEVQRYTFKPSKPSRNRKYIFWQCFLGDYADIFPCRGVWRLLSRCLGPALGETDSPRVAPFDRERERERAHGRCLLPFALTGNRFSRSSKKLKRWFTFQKLLAVAETVEAARQFGRTKTGTMG